MKRRLGKLMNLDFLTHPELVNDPRYFLECARDLGPIALWGLLALYSRAWRCRTCASWSAPIYQFGGDAQLAARSYLAPEQ